MVETLEDCFEMSASPHMTVEDSDVLVEIIDEQILHEKNCLEVQYVLSYAPK